MKITYANKESLITSPLPEENKVTDDDMNEIKNVVNSNDDSFQSATEITTGTGTMSTTYTDTVEQNHYEKYGKVVSYSFTFRAKGTWGSTSEFITGLPKPKSVTRFMGINASSQVPARFVITADGTIQNAYTGTAPTPNQVIEGHITYITID